MIVRGFIANPMSPEAGLAPKPYTPRSSVRAEKTAIGSSERRIKIMKATDIHTKLLVSAIVIKYLAYQSTESPTAWRSATFLRESEGGSH
jgi:hypothetical protein